MKKILSIAIAALLVLGFAASAFAIHAEIPAETQAVVAKGTTQITIGGELRLRGWYTHNRAAVTGFRDDLFGNDGIDEQYSYNGVSSLYFNRFGATAGTPPNGFTNAGFNLYQIGSTGAILPPLVAGVGTVGGGPIGLWHLDWPAFINSAGTVIRLVDFHNNRPNWLAPGAAALGVDAQSAAWYDYRIRLSIEAKVTPNLVGFVQLESTGTGYDNTNDKYVFGTSNGNSAFSNAHPRSDFNFLQAWINYQGTGLFGFNSGIKVGHMPLALSHKQFYDHTQMGDDALVFYMDPTKDIHIGLLTIKLNEGATTDNTDDLDAYVALMTYQYKTHKFGINYTYVNGSNGLIGPTQFAPVGLGVNGGPDDENKNGIKLHNLAAHAEGTIGNFGYKGEFDIQFGHQDDGSDCDINPVTAAVSCDGDQKRKYKGWALFLAANYKINTVNLRGSFAYGSGDNSAKDHDIKEFVPFVGNVQNYSFIYEYLHNTTAANVSGLNGPLPTNGHAAGIANTTYYNLGVDWQATKDLGLSLDGYIFRASKSGYFEDYLRDMENTLNAFGVPNDWNTHVSKNAGWEVDFKAKYQIAKNLSYQFDFGYFKPGHFYEDVYGIDTKGVSVARHTLTLSF